MRNRPNVLLIVWHDLGDWLGCYRHAAVPSPHLDQLAAQGALLTRCFSTGAVCSPGRASLMTGLMPHAAGVNGLTNRGFDMRRAVAGDNALAEEANAVLASVGLEDKAEISAKLLSYGERRALEIAVALAQRPRVLCLDEPTSGLGTDGTLRIAELIRSLKKKLTIIAVEHDMRFLFSLADRISVIHWGQVVARGTPRVCPVRTRASGQVGLQAPGALPEPPTREHPRWAVPQSWRRASPRA